MKASEEHRLIGRAAAGDRAAAESLIRCHQASLFGYLLRMSGRPDVAEDVVQEAFVRVLKNLDRFDDRYRFSTWLFTIARRLYLNQREKLHPAYDSDAVGLAAGRESRPEALAAEAEAGVQARGALESALLEVSLDQREVLVLFHQHDWPIWLIARHLGMPQGTVKSHLHRGRRRLREILSGTALAARFEGVSP